MWQQTSKMTRWIKMSEEHNKTGLSWQDVCSDSTALYKCGEKKASAKNTNLRLQRTWAHQNYTVVDWKKCCFLYSYYVSYIIIYVALTVCLCIALFVQILILKKDYSNVSSITIVMPSINGVTKYIGGLEVPCSISLNEAKRSVQHTIHKIMPKICTQRKKEWQSANISSQTYGNTLKTAI